MDGLSGKSLYSWAKFHGRICIWTIRTSNKSYLYVISDEAKKIVDFLKTSKDENDKLDDNDCIIKNDEGHMFHLYSDNLLMTGELDENPDELNGVCFFGQRFVINL